MKADLIEKRVEKKPGDSTPTSGGVSELLNGTSAVQAQIQLRATLNQRSMPLTMHPTVQRMRGRGVVESPDDYATAVANFENFAQRGMQLWESINAATVEVDHGEAYRNRYETLGQSDVVAPASRAIAHPQGFTKFETRARGAETAAYTSMIREDTLVATHNYAKDDTLPSDSAEGAEQTRRLNHSEVLFQHLRQADEAEPSPQPHTASLNQVIRVNIQNATTMEIMNMCLSNIGERMQTKTFPAGTQEFFALLATDNCKGVAFMLKDHPESFQHKTITFIDIVNYSALVLHIGQL